MASLNPYLFFNGTCREAMEFYERCFGGKLELMTYGDAKGEGCPLAERNKIMHGALTAKGVMVMASDRADKAPTPGDNVSLSLTCDSLSELEELFKALSDQGQVGLPLHDAFWGDRFGALTDRFGINWMLNAKLG